MRSDRRAPHDRAAAEAHAARLRPTAPRAVLAAALGAALTLAGGCGGAPIAAPPPAEPAESRAPVPLARSPAALPADVAQPPALPASLLGRKPATGTPGAGTPGAGTPGAGASGPDDAALAGSWARVFLRANPGPYQYVAYEIHARGQTGVISHLRAVMGRPDPVIQTELIAWERLRENMASLAAMGAADLRDPGNVAPPAPPARPAKIAREGRAVAQVEETEGILARLPARSEVPIYEVAFRLGGRETSFLVADPYVLADRSYATFINAVRRVVIAEVGDIGWHGPTGGAGQTGYLFVDSVPGARVTVDGVQLAEETPVLSYPVAPGEHEVVLENDAHHVRRSWKVKIEAGMTTSLEVELR